MSLWQEGLSKMENDRIRASEVRKITGIKDPGTVTSHRQEWDANEDEKGWTYSREKVLAYAASKHKTPKAQIATATQTATTPQGTEILPDDALKVHNQTLLVSEQTKLIEAQIKLSEAESKRDLPDVIKANQAKLQGEMDKFNSEVQQWVAQKNTKEQEIADNKAHYESLLDGCTAECEAMKAQTKNEVAAIRQGATTLDAEYKKKCDDLHSRTLKVADKEAKIAGEYEILKSRQSEVETKHKRASGALEEYGYMLSNLATVIGDFENRYIYIPKIIDSYNALAMWFNKQDYPSKATIFITQNSAVQMLKKR